MQLYWYYIHIVRYMILDNKYRLDCKKQRYKYKYINTLITRCTYSLSFFCDIIVDSFLLLWFLLSLGNNLNVDCFKKTKCILYFKYFLYMLVLIFFHIVISIIVLILIYFSIRHLYIEKSSVYLHQIPLDHYFSFEKLKTIVTYSNTDTVSYKNFLDFLQSFYESEKKSNYDGYTILLDNHQASAYHHRRMFFFETEIEEYSERDDPFIEDYVGYEFISRYLASPLFIEVTSELNEYSILYLDQKKLCLEKIFENPELKIIKDNSIRLMLNLRSLFLILIKSNDLVLTLKDFFKNIYYLFLPNYINLSGFHDISYEEIVLIDIYHQTQSLPEIIHVLQSLHQADDIELYNHILSKEFLLEHDISEYNAFEIYLDTIEYSRYLFEITNCCNVNNLYNSKNTFFLDRYYLFYLFYIIKKCFNLNDKYRLYLNGGIV